MNLTFGYQVNPGSCHICHSSATCKVIDTSADDLGHIRRYRVYLCELCVTAAYQMLEPTKVLIEKDQVTSLEGQITALTNEVLTLRAEADLIDQRIAKALQS